MSSNELPRLCSKNLHHSRATTILPGYDRSTTNPGVIHLGLGNFHRAHQAIFIERALEQGDKRWGIVGVSMRNPSMRDDLQPQDNLYSVHFDDGHRKELRVVGCLKDVLVASENQQRLWDSLLSDAAHLVTLTITEKGYCRASANNDLDFGHADIQHDLLGAEFPRSAIGLISAAIVRRKYAGAKPLVFMSCDNLASNSKVLRRLVSQFMTERYPDLTNYVNDRVAFPCSMVDRIVPQVTEEKGDKISELLGLRDSRPIDTEPFSQWVVEDVGEGEAPPWEDVGVTLTRNVEDYELAKLRLLNGSHSAIAYLGYLSGHETVSDAMADAGLSSYIVSLLREELAPTVPPIHGFDLSDYAAKLCTRFRNPGLAHKTTQIAMDGSQKIPQRILAPIRARLAQNAPFPRLSLAVAAWIRFVSGYDEHGRPIEVKDPLVKRFSVFKLHRDNADVLTTAALGIREVFGDDLPANAQFHANVRNALHNIITRGAASSIRALIT